MKNNFTMEAVRKNQGNLADLVLGLGRSGRALGNHLERLRHPFWIYDDKGVNMFASLLAAWPHAQWLADHTSVSRILLSPGVPAHHPLLARAQGIPIISELEFAWQLAKIPIIAITGTNGKSTTTALVEHFLTHAGYRAKACGNFGIPLLEVIDSEIPLDALVVEVSSFQAEASPTFKPRYAALLNVTPDHLDRYASMDDYLAAKLAMIANQDTNDILVVNAEEPAFFKAVHLSRAQCLPFSSAKSLTHGAYLSGSSLVLALPGSTETISLEKNPLLGIHHLENILAAALLARTFGVTARDIEAALASFKGLPHRVERVREKNGVVFYDDSKATNVGALAMSLASFDKKVVLIAGGRDKGSDFASLAPLIRAKVRAIFLIGEAADKMAEQWQNTVPIVKTRDIEQAVNAAYEAARPDRHPVLLAPACASFDQFSDYKHRGRAFQEAVQRLC